jgi:HK97 family phage major capsid protein
MAERKPVDGLEGELSKHIEQKQGMAARGLLAPFAVLTRHARAMAMRRAVFAAAIDTTTGSGGVSTINDDIVIDVWRPVMVTARLGATVLTGLPPGKRKFPRLQTDFTNAWPGDGVAAGASSAVFDSVTLTPKITTVYSDLTLNFFREISPSLESFAEQTVFRNLGAALDGAAINGTGGTNIPLGILNNTASASIILGPGTTAASGAVPLNASGVTVTWMQLIQASALVGAANTEIDSGGYVFSSSGLANLKVTPKAVGASMFLAEDGEIDGQPVIGTNSCPSTNGTNSNSTAGIYGNWRDCIVGMWGAGVDLLVNPYTLASSGVLKLSAFLACDVGLRNPRSFARLYGLAGMSV